MSDCSISYRKPIVVDVPQTLIGKPVAWARYAILCDRTVDEITAYVDANRPIIVFPFATKSVAEMLDYSVLMESPLVDKYGNDIAKPAYVGNLHHIGSVIQQIVEIGFGPYYKDAICILNEWGKANV